MRGRPRSPETAHLPPGLIQRTRGGNPYYFYCKTPKKGARRREVPLGRSLSDALATYHSMTAERAYIKHSHKPMLPWVAKEMFETCRSHSARRGIPFKLTLGDVETLLAESRHRCALTGIHFETRKPEGARFRHWMPSIDRIKCAGCYELGNVRLVAMAVNIALNDLGEDTLIHIARMLLRHRRAMK